MKFAKFTTTAAAAIVAATGAFAQSTAAPETEADVAGDAQVKTEMSNKMDTASDQAAPAQDDVRNDAMHADAKLIRSRDITGGAIYSMADAQTGDWTADTRYEQVENGWNEIGEIEDLVLSEDGELIGIVAEVGGFLDIGDKHVMIELDDTRLVAVDDRSYSLVTRLSEEQLEEMPGVDEAAWN